MRASLGRARSGAQAAVFLAAVLSVMPGARAAELPGSADVGRMDQREGLQKPEPNLLLPAQPMQSLPVTDAPPGSEQIRLTLKDVRTTGMSVFTIADIKDIYEPYLGREVTLDTVWMIAGQITERYHNAGYFLTRAVVPKQKIDNGIVNLRITEGYIGEVKFDDDLNNNPIIRQWIDKLLSYRPLKTEDIESVLLHLNDLPGVDLRSVLEPMPAAEKSDGAVRLILERQEAPSVSGKVGFDNYGSRFLGPYQAHAQAQIVFWPMHKTAISVLSSAFPWNRVAYGALKHEMPLFAGGTLELFGSYATAAPGYTLRPQEIRSWSPTLGAAFGYRIIRQRQENLSTRVSLEMHNAHTDILGVALTRDDIRTARFNIDYQNADNWNGQNVVDATVSQGLPFLGASRRGQLNLSRAEAEPDFTKFALGFSRHQNLAEGWGLSAAVTGQVASVPLYASEQFGYGGQSFGRAYDDSEITGDDGVAASFELQYAGLGPWYGVQPVLYPFYDIGAVWNLGRNPTTPHASGSSAGAGIKIFSEYGFAANVGLAFPLTRKIANPIYGNGKSPRYFMQVSYMF